MTGRKDPDLSDSLEEACEVGQLPWILRKAVHFLTRIEVGLMLWLYDSKYSNGYHIQMSQHWEP
jgi:hypothetical protein